MASCVMHISALGHLLVEHTHSPPHQQPNLVFSTPQPQSISLRWGKLHSPDRRPFHLTLPTNCDVCAPTPTPGSPHLFPGCEVRVPPRRRDDQARYKNLVRNKGRPPAVWGYDASEPADVGRLFVADNVVTHVKSDVWTWDWSAMLPVLESVQVLLLLLLL